MKDKKETKKETKKATKKVVVAEDAIDEDAWSGDEMDSADIPENRDNEEFQHIEENDEYVEEESGNEAGTIDSQYEVEEVNFEGEDPDEHDRMELNTNQILEGADLQLMKVKAEEILKILSMFKERREENKPRYEYLEELKEIFVRLYGYNPEIMNLFFNLFSPHEVKYFFIKIRLINFWNLTRIKGH